MKTKLQSNNSLFQNTLIVLLILQLIFSIGYMNEFDDHLVMVVMAAGFFLFQVYFLFKARRTKIIIGLVALITILHLFNLAAFINEGTGVISNNWPEELYHQTYVWVILMGIGAIVIDVVKFIVLYRQRPFPNKSTAN